MNKTAFLNKKKVKDLIFYICIVALPVLQFCVFYLYVNANMFFLGFQKYDYGTAGSPAGYRFLTGEHFFDNFIAFFDSAFGNGDNYALKYAVKNSFIVFFVVYVFHQALSLLFAYYIFKKRAGSGFFRVTLFMPSVVSSIVICLIFLYVAEDAIPALWKQLTGGSIAGLLTDETKRFPLLVFFAIFIGFGSSTLLYTGAMNGINDSTLEAAKLDGANDFKEFFYVVFPLIYPNFITFIIASCAGIFTNQLNLFSIYGGGTIDYELYTMGYYLYNSTKYASFTEYPILSAIGLVVTVVTVPITFIVNKLLKKFGPSVE